MHQMLALYLQNVEKIKLYFGTDADKFGYHLAVRYTVKGNVFHYADYEKIAQEIKKHTKWYSFAAVNFNILTSYAAHFGKDVDKVAPALQYYKLLTNYFTRGEHSYLAAMYGTTLEDAQRVDALTKTLAKLPALQFFTLPLQTRALLATLPEEVEVLAASVQHYYTTLISLGFTRHSSTLEAAAILTLASGNVDEQLITQIKHVLAILTETNTTLKKRHYFVVILLALVNAKAHDFIELYELHEQLCAEAKLRPNYHPTLLIATQLYTVTSLPISFASSEFSFSDTIHLFDSSSDIDGGGDGGGGGD